MAHLKVFRLFAAFEVMFSFILTLSKKTREIEVTFCVCCFDTFHFPPDFPRKNSSKRWRIRSAKKYREIEVIYLFAVRRHFVFPNIFLNPPLTPLLLS